MILAVYSWAGGVGKTTTAVALAMTAAARGDRVLLVDTDPRAAATRWAAVEPSAPGLHVGAILAAPDPAGWAERLAVATSLHPMLRVVPSHIQVANRDADTAVYPERLARSLAECDADVIIIDAPNRLNGQIIENVLRAAQQVVLAATASEDGAEGIEGAATTIADMPAQVRPRIAGIVATSIQDTVRTRVQRSVLAGYADTGLLLGEIPQRVAVQEARRAARWIDTNDPRAAAVSAAYEAVYDRVRQH